MSQASFRETKRLLRADGAVGRTEKVVNRLIGYVYASACDATGQMIVFVLWAMPFAKFRLGVPHHQLSQSQIL